MFNLVERGHRSVFPKKSSILKNLCQNVKICDEDWQKKDFIKIFGKT